MHSFSGNFLFSNKLMKQLTNLQRIPFFLKKNSLTIVRVAYRNVTDWTDSRSDSFVLWLSLTTIVLMGTSVGHFNESTFIEKRKLTESLNL
jgi:hypothetical protein